MVELTEVSQRIRDLRREIKELRVAGNKKKAELKDISDEYKLLFAFQDWKSKEGKCFEVLGFEETEHFYCNVLEVDETGFLYEYINETDGYHSVEKIEDMKQDCDYRQWNEITQEEYNEKKVGKFSA